MDAFDFHVGECDWADRFLADRIYEFNARATGYSDGESFAAVRRDESETIVAGISGYTWGAAAMSLISGFPSDLALRVLAEHCSWPLKLMPRARAARSSCCRRTVSSHQRSTRKRAICRWLR